jgi:BON domain
MAERVWRDEDPWRDRDPRRYRQEGTGRGTRGPSGWGGDDARRQSPEGERHAGAGSDWHDQADGLYSRPAGGREGGGPGSGWRTADAHYGEYTGSQYGGVSSAGRGYPESDVMPRRDEWSPRASDERTPAGSTGEWRGGESPDPWRGSGSSGRDNHSWNEPSWGSAGSYGRSQGAGSWGGAPGGAWPTGGDQGSTAFRPRESYHGRGPKGYTRSDDRIREDVSERLADDPTVDASDITVAVQGGEVTLTGTVNSRDQKRRAEDCVEAVSGVREVINQLRLRRLGGTESETLAASEQSSSLLGLGGQPSREDGETPVTSPEATARGGKRSGTTDR